MNQRQEWDQLLIPYNQAVEELKVKLKAIRNGFRNAGEYSPIEFVTGRVKKVSSIIAKAKLRNVDLEHIEDEIEDIAGIRIMCQLVDDIFRVVELLRNRKDFEIVFENDYINNKKESGYQSYHVVIRYPIHTAFGYKNILAEIQIRTMAMNFWATIEHSLNYKYKHEVPQQIKERLKTAAEAVSILDREMAEIKEEIILAQVSFEKNSSLVKYISEALQKYRTKNDIVKYRAFLQEFYQLVDDGSLEELYELLDKINQEMS